MQPKITNKTKQNDSWPKILAQKYSQKLYSWQHQTGNHPSVYEFQAYVFFPHIMFVCAVVSTHLSTYSKLTKNGHPCFHLAFVMILDLNALLNFVFDFLFYIGDQQINKVMIFSGAQQNDSGICMHVSILHGIPLPSRLTYKIGKSSLSLLFLNTVM